MSESQNEYVRAGDLGSRHVGRGIWAPASLNYDTREWEYGWRRMSMISHIAAGVKVRCRNSSHGDHTFAPGDQVLITRKEFNA